MRTIFGLRDRYGLRISTRSEAAAASYMEGLDLLLEQSYGAEDCLQQAVSEDEGFALGHATLALAQMAHADGRERATVERARELAAGATRRERQHIEALALFMHAEGRRAIALVRDHLGEFPRDAMMVRLAHRLYLLGCNGAGVPSFQTALFELVRSLEPSYGEEWTFLGHDAFAHHEMGYHDRALDLAERSLALRPTSGYAAHSVAHAHFEQGNAAEGGAFLGGWLRDFDRRATFNCHLSWHQALFLLAEGRYDAALAVYEDSIRPTVQACSPLSLADSASLTWRMHLYTQGKADVPYAEVGQQAASAAVGHGPGFRDAHAALAYAANRQDESLEQLAVRLQAAANGGEALAREVTLPIVRGVAAFAREDFAEAARRLDLSMPQLSRLGGSHAQREVFEDTFVEACLRAGQLERADGILQERLGRRMSARDCLWLARIRTWEGDTEAARDLLDRVARSWRQADPDSAENTVIRGLKAESGAELSA